VQDPAEINQVVDHLFRHEAGKLVSVLTRIFGSDNMDLAEDVVQDSLIEAMTHWQYKGVPENPSAWIFRVAKNKALNALAREKHKRQYASEVSHYLQSEWTSEPAFTHFFSEQEIQDDQLRMIFTCCHPAISRDSQIALALKTLCGFSIPEIARAFITSEENINKRLVRARKKIRDDKIPFEVPEGKDLRKRKESVLETIYLLFNEGYSASKGQDLIRYELCEEAIRLTEMIAANKSILQKDSVYAILSLMYLNASRFNARLSPDGNLLTMAEQDRSQWNKKMIDTGLTYMAKAVEDDELSIYHILAAISGQHCIAPDYASTDWKTILSLYDHLIRIDSSPVVLLNRTVAVSKARNTAEALSELEQIKKSGSISSYYLLHSTEAEFLVELGRFDQAAKSLEQAIALASIDSEKEFLQKRLDFCRQKLN